MSHHWFITSNLFIRLSYLFNTEPIQLKQQKKKRQLPIVCFSRILCFADFRCCGRCVVSRCCHGWLNTRLKSPYKVYTSHINSRFKWIIVIFLYFLSTVQVVTRVLRTYAITQKAREKKLFKHRKIVVIKKISYRYHQTTLTLHVLLPSFLHLRQAIHFSDVISFLTASDLCTLYLQNLWYDWQSKVFILLMMIVCNASGCMCGELKWRRRFGSLTKVQWFSN